MNNSKNEKLSECERFQICVLSDEQLTQELKRHLESCGECRAFLQQNSRIRDELSGLCVPDLKDGEISSRVMKEIRASKSIKFPRVRLSHHIGTAAALVIVIAIFAASKGYNFTGMIASQNSTNGYKDAEISDSTDSGSGFTPINGVFTSPDGVKENSDSENTFDDKQSAQNSPEQENETAVQNDENPTVTFRISHSGGGADANVAEESKSAQKRTATYTVSPEISNSQPSENAADNSTVNFNPGNAQNDVYTGDIMLSLSSSVSPLNSDSDFAENPETAANDSSAAENPENSDLICALPKCDDSENAGSDSSIGGSSSPNKAAAANSNEIDFEDDKAGFYDSVSESYNSIFEGLEFDQSDDSLDTNVTAANKYVKSIFEDACQLRAEALINVGITNSMFIEWTKTVENPEQYSFESVYEYYSR